MPSSFPSYSPRYIRSIEHFKRSDSWLEHHVAVSASVFSRSARLLVGWLEHLVALVAVEYAFSWAANNSCD